MMWSQAKLGARTGGRFTAIASVIRKTDVGQRHCSAKAAAGATPGALRQNRPSVFPQRHPIPYPVLRLYNGEKPELEREIMQALSGFTRRGYFSVPMT